MKSCVTARQWSVITNQKHLRRSIVQQCQGLHHASLCRVYSRCHAYGVVRDTPRNRVLGADAVVHGQPKGRGRQWLGLRLIRQQFKGAFGIAIARSPNDRHVCMLSAIDIQHH